MCQHDGKPFCINCPGSSEHLVPPEPRSTVMRETADSSEGPGVPLGPRKEKNRCRQNLVGFEKERKEFDI